MRVKGLKGRGGEYRKLTANEGESFEYCRALRGDRVYFFFVTQPTSPDYRGLMHLHGAAEA